MQGWSAGITADLATSSASKL